jgi:tetratricopeptide (TPR) repeat protein
MSPHRVDRTYRFALPNGLFATILIVASVLTIALISLPANAGDKATDEMIAQAHKAMMSGRPADAVPILRKAIELEPTNAELYMMRSRAYDSSGKMDAAIEDANKCIDLAPNDAQCYLNRARIYMSMEKNDSALEDTNKAISLAPDEPDGYFRRADIYNDMGKDDLAKADEAKGDELDKKSR